MSPFPAYKKPKSAAELFCVCNFHSAVSVSDDIIFSSAVSTPVTDGKGEGGDCDILVVLVSLITKRVNRIKHIQVVTTHMAKNFCSSTVMSEFNMIGNSSAELGQTIGNTVLLRGILDRQGPPSRHFEIHPRYNICRKLKRRDPFLNTRKIVQVFTPHEMTEQ